MKKKTYDKIVPKLLKGLTGILFAVSTFFILPGLLYAEEPGHVMPQEQVFLDPSQVEAAKKQLEDDAAVKSGPRTKNVEVVTGDRVIADVKVVEQNYKTNATATDTVSETKKSEESNKATDHPAKVEAEKPVPAVKQESKETKPETVQPQKPVQEKTEISKTAGTKVTQPDTKPGVTAAENKNETATSQAQPVLQHKPVRLSRFGVANGCSVTGNGNQSGWPYGVSPVGNKNHGRPGHPRVGTEILPFKGRGGSTLRDKGY